MLSACSADAPDPPREPTSASTGEMPIASPSAPVPPENAITSATELIGEYRVAGLDGRSIDLPHGLTVSIRQDTIVLFEGCMSMAWRYHFDAGRLVTARRHDLVGRCTRPPQATEEAIGLAFDAATGVRRTPANGIDFYGGGHTVTLFSQ